MAWGKDRAGQWIVLVPDGTTDFIWETEFPDEPAGIPVKEIQVYFSAANDKVAIRTHRSTMEPIFQYTTLDGASVAKLFHGGLMKPRILHADQTYGTPANWLIIIQIGS